MTVSFSGSPRLQLRLRWRKDLAIAWDKSVPKGTSADVVATRYGALSIEPTFIFIPADVSIASEWNFRSRKNASDHRASRANRPSLDP